jgi:hypothetical protein
MSVTDTFQYSLTGDDSSRLSGNGVEVGAAHIKVSTSIPAASTNLPVTCAFTQANLQGLILVASQNMTIKTNSSGSPADTINLVAGVPLVWEKSGSYFACPFTSNCTGWFVTSTNAGTLQAIFLSS